MDTITPNVDELRAKSYNKRKLNRLRRRRKMRRLKILLARLRVMTRMVCFVLLIWGFFKVATLPGWYLMDDIFSAYPSNYYEFEGNEIIKDEQLVAALTEVKLPDKPLYLIDTKQIEKKLLEMAPVNRVFVRRYWLPARLRIVIDERTPIISIAPNYKIEPIAIFTLDGTNVEYFEKEYLPLPEHLGTFRIITYDDYKEWKPAQIPYIKKLGLYLEGATGDRLVYIDIRNPDDVYAQMENVRLRIGALKGNEVFKRLKKVSSVMPDAMKMRENINYIDLRWNNVSIKLKKS